MDIAQMQEDNRISKKPRHGEPGAPTQNGIVVLSLPELDQIKQSDNQVAFLQAQLAATEALYSAYQEELHGLAKVLVGVKRVHAQQGLPLWKDGAALAASPVPPPRRQRQQQPSAEGPWDDDPDTFSDIEEQVLIIPDDDMCRPNQNQTPPAQPGGPEGQAEAAVGCSLVAPEKEPGPFADGGALGPGEEAGRAAAAAPTGAETSAAAAAVGEGRTEPASTPITAPVEAPAGAAAAGAEAAAGGQEVATAPGDRDRLEVLEAICSAVAQEDMEALGAVACLAGRNGKYYLRSIVVALGRTTESKGDVDLDLTTEEPAPLARGQGDAAGGGGVLAAGAATLGPGAAGPPTAAAKAAATRGHLVSRRQALIRLGADGQFRLVNMGRQPVVVNGIEVPQHQTVNLPHLSLVEISSAVRLLFLVNLAAVARVMRRSAALSL